LELIYIPLASLEKYHTMCSWFLGHRGENTDIMKHTMNSIVDEVKAGRIAFGSDDDVRQSVILPHSISYTVSATLASCRISSPQPFPIQ
jgi:hypothetical protein